MPKFKKMRGIPLPYNQQGLLFFQLRNYRHQPRTFRDRVDATIGQVTDDPAYRIALFDTLTTDKSIASISMRHCVSETCIYRMRGAFYMHWYQGGGE